MIANVQYEIQIVDTHESLETLVNAGVAVGTSQFNRTLVLRNTFLQGNVTSTEAVGEYNFTL